MHRHDIKKQPVTSIDLLRIINICVYGCYIFYYEIVIPACLLRESPADNEEIPVYAGMTNPR